MVKLKMSEIEIMLTQFNTLSKEKFSSRVSYIISRWGKALESEFKDYMAHYGELQKKYAKLDDEGKIVTEKDDNDRDVIVFEKGEEGKNEFTKEREELYSTEIELPLTKIKLSEVANKELPANIFIDFDPMFEDDSEAPDKIH